MNEELEKIWEMASLFRKGEKMSGVLCAILCSTLANHVNWKNQIKIIREIAEKIIMLCPVEDEVQK